MSSLSKTQGYSHWIQRGVVPPRKNYQEVETPGRRGDLCRTEEDGSKDPVSPVDSRPTHGRQKSLPSVLSLCRVVVGRRLVYVIGQEF